MVGAGRDKEVAFGPFTLTGRLGEGGMCHVFAAYRNDTGEACAVKLLKEERRKDERIRDLFVTEADLSMLLRHPNLVRALDAGEHAGRFYIAMELIEGAHLGQIAARCAALGAPLPRDFALYAVNELLEGLHAIHDATARSGRPLGLVHRDVTPSNVFVSFDGRVILGDLGIAHIEAYGAHEPGEAVGKLGYFAPEVLSGEPIDRRTDLFAVGVILWELLVGQPLFDGDEQAVMARIVGEDAPRVRRLRPSVSRGLDALVAKALARKPKERFQSAEEMAYDLEPHWSQLIGNPIAFRGFLRGLLREEARRADARVRRRPRSTGSHDAIVLTPIPGLDD